MKVIIILGPPGSGKGTQAGLLADKLKLYYFETSKLLEAAFQEAKKGDFAKGGKEKYDLLAERKKWEKGELNSPPFVTHLVKQEIRELYSRGQNLVLAGSPRTLYEGEHIIPLLKKLYGAKSIKVLLLKIGIKESIWRNSHRRLCQLFRHPILWTQETAKLKHCPLDGSRLVRRKLDKPNVIRVRWQEYQERTLPLVKFFREEGLEVKEVNGEPSVAEVFESILKTLE